MGKKFCYALGCLAVLLLAAGYAIGAYFVGYALERGNDSDPLARPPACDAIADPSLKAPPLPAFPHEEWEIKSADGLILKATYFSPEEDWVAKGEKSNRWAILVHGYGRTQEFAWDYADEYLKRGYRVLTPDLRAAGKSEGRYLTMGAKESEDIMLWAEKIREIDPQARISLHGVSMGGATVMLASGMPIPGLYAVVEDCGYTGAYEMFTAQLGKLFGLPGFPIMNCVDIVSLLKTGVRVSDMAPIKAVPRTKVPMLFIHGDADGLVPYEMLGELTAASQAPVKETFTVAGAAHADAKKTNPPAYFERVFAFLDAQAARK